VFVPHTPGNMKDLASQIQETIFAAQKLEEGGTD